MEILNQIHTFSSFALFGLIWTVQLVHYPTFLYVSEGEFSKFEDFHKKAITLIVMPLMLLELLSATGLLYFEYNTIHLINFVIVTLIWMSTMFISVPLHNDLSDGKNEKSIEKLISTNWIRTILWSIKSGILLLANYH